MTCGPGLSPGPGLLGFPGEPANTTALVLQRVPLLFSFMANLDLSKGSESFGGPPHNYKSD